MREEELALTSMEFELLLFFASHPGTAFSRDQLLREIWDDNCGGYAFTVNAMIARLRKKIEDNPKHPRYLLTVRGLGYRFAEPQELA